MSSTSPPSSATAQSATELEQVSRACSTSPSCTDGEQERGRSSERTEATAVRSRSRSSSRERERERSDDRTGTVWYYGPDDNSTWETSNWWTRLNSLDNRVVAPSAEAERQLPSSWPPLCSSGLAFPMWTTMFRGCRCLSVFPTVVVKMDDDDDDEFIARQEQRVFDAEELSHLAGRERSLIVLEKDANNNIPYELFFHGAAPQAYRDFYYMSGAYTHNTNPKSKTTLTLAVFHVDLRYADGAEDTRYGLVTVVPDGTRAFEMPLGSDNDTNLTTEILMFLAGLHVILPPEAKSVTPAVGLVKRHLAHIQPKNINTWSVAESDTTKTTGSFAVLLYARVGSDSAKLYE